MSGCVLCLDRPARQPLPDSLACKDCTEELGRILDRIAALLPQLRALITEVNRAGYDDERRTGAGAYGPAPLNVDALSLLDPRNTDSPGIVLSRWGVAFGTSSTPAGLKAALGRIIEDDRLRRFVLELRALTRELERVCGVPKSRIVATCRRETEAGTECGGPIVATPGGEVATCTACGDVWPRARWRLLGRLQDA